MMIMVMMKTRASHGHVIVVVIITSLREHEIITRRLIATLGIPKPSTLLRTTTTSSTTSRLMLLLLAITTINYEQLSLELVIFVIEERDPLVTKLAVILIDVVDVAV
jgi:hypothetical protein